jgi:hypothetical protein
MTFAEPLIRGNVQRGTVDVDDAGHGEFLCRSDVAICLSESRARVEGCQSLPKAKKFRKQIIDGGLEAIPFSADLRLVVPAKPASAAIAQEQRKMQAQIGRWL